MGHKVFIRHTYIYKCSDEVCGEEWKINEASSVEKLRCHHCCKYDIVHYVDVYQRTSVKNIFAIGDIVGNPMLAHKATHEGKVAAEVCSGHPAAMDYKAIPSVVYTDPEVAWAGLNEV